MIGAALPLWVMLVSHLHVWRGYFTDVYSAHITYQPFTHRSAQLDISPSISRHIRPVSQVVCCSTFIN